MQPSRADPERNLKRPTPSAYFVRAYQAYAGLHGICVDCSTGHGDRVSSWRPEKFPGIYLLRLMSSGAQGVMFIHDYLGQNRQLVRQ